MSDLLAKNNSAKDSTTLPPASTFTIPWRDLKTALRHVLHWKFLLPAVLLAAISGNMPRLLMLKTELAQQVITWGLPAIQCLTTCIMFALLGYCFQQGLKRQPTFPAIRGKQFLNMMGGGFLLYLLFQLLSSAILWGINFGLFGVLNALLHNFSETTKVIIGIASLGVCFMAALTLFFWRIDFFVGLVLAVWFTNRPTASFSATARQAALHGLKRRALIKLFFAAILIFSCVVGSVNLILTILMDKIATATQLVINHHVQNLSAYFAIWTSILMIVAGLSNYVKGVLAYWLGLILHRQAAGQSGQDVSGQTAA